MAGGTIQDVLITLATALATGGAGALTTSLAFFRDIKKRLKELEEKVGTDTEPRTGLHLLARQAGDIARGVQRKIEGWEDNPPEWAVRLVNRSRTSTLTGVEREIEDRLDGKLRDVVRRLRDVENGVDQVERSSQVDIIPTEFVRRDEYQKDSKERSEEVQALRRELAAANGMLRGVLASMGVLDVDTPAPQGTISSKPPRRTPPP
jgi:hypothetical protein